jgi:general stress protein 26
MMSDKIRQTILDILQPMQTVMLATCSNDQPYVRPMILIYEKDRFFFATGTADAKSKQIAENPKAEICLYFNTEQSSGYVRATGYLETISDSEVRKEIHNVAGFIQNYFPQPDDPGFALYRMIWQKAEYMHPVQSQTVSINW